MGPRFNARGRGGGRGRGRGGGRGRGRGGTKGRWQSRFDSSRLAEKQEENEEELVEEESEEASESESESEEEESDSERKKRTYLSLLQSLESESSQRTSKKRKLDGVPETKSEEVEERDEEVAGSEADSDGDDSADDDADLEPKDIDHVEGDEDEAEEEDEADAEDDDDDREKDKNTADPFQTHFANPDTEDVARRLRAIAKNDWTTVKTTQGRSRLIFSLPTSAAAGFAAPAPVTGPQDLVLKARLLEGVLASKRPTFDAIEQQLAPLLFNYHDMLYCERTPDKAASLRRIVSLHAVNHVFKTRDRVLKNNAKAARDEAEGRDGEYRDQGYTRPKVLMLLPTRQACVRMVDAICAVSQPDQQEHRKRFDEAFDEAADESHTDRPADFRELFDGNDDDMFRLGLKFTRRSLRFYAPFYGSDILLASPLGLRMAMGSSDTLATTGRERGGGGSGGHTKKPAGEDWDFLSGIELVVVDQADALLMQNWEHVEHIFAHLNRQPREAHGCDFARVRPWSLDGAAQHYRQTVVLSAFATPALAELLRRHAPGWAGKVRVQPAVQAGVVGRLGVRGVRQTFARFAAADVAAEPDARFEYFVRAVVPALLGRTKSGAAAAATGTLVFVPSYLDFVRVRNWFAAAVATAHVSFGQVSEYASVAEASRTLSHFFAGRHSVLLYSERAHHFRRHQISGVRRVVFYGLPDNPAFYTEIAGGFLARSQRRQPLGPGAVRALFCRYDALKLERIVGSERAGQMLRETSDTFVLEEER